MSLPYYKRFPRDFLEGTVALTFEEKGAYAIVLDLIYMRDGRLEDSPRYIAGQLGCSVRKWQSIRLGLIGKGKIHVADGIISNFRANYLLEETRSFRDKQAENRSKPNKNRNIQSPKIDQPDTEPEPEEKIRNCTGYARDGWPENSRVVETLISESGLVLSQADTWHLRTAGVIALWKHNGFDFEQEVLPTVRAIVSGGSVKIKTWGYFTDAIAQCRADRTKPIPIPEPRSQNERGSSNHRTGHKGFDSTVSAMHTAIEALAEKDRRRFSG